MSPPSDPAARSLAAGLEPLLHRQKARLTISEMVARIQGDNGLGPVLFALSLPLLLPLPPGMSMVLALPLLVVAPQIIVSRQRLWLPKTLMRHSIKQAELVKLLRRVLPLLRRVEARARPRLSFMTGRIGTGLIGVACTLIALVLVLPIPFANLIPALALGLFALGLTRKDGLFVMAGYGLLVVAAAVIALGVHGFAWAFGQLRTLL